jgi:voltage-gated potassium channel
MNSRSSWRTSLYTIIFGHTTRAGRTFDLILIGAILISVAAVMLDSVTAIRDRWGPILYAAEWAFTILFTIEYLLRLACHPKPWRYAISFFGIVELLSILPTYLSIILPSSRYLLIIRILRVLRVYRILKLVQYMGEADRLIVALRESRRKISIFFLAVVSLAVILGSGMYMVEGPSNGFTSIPRSVYWAIVTLTTVGYGDVTPHTPWGQALASLVMILGYAIIAVPTSIVTVELTKAHGMSSQRPSCGSCNRAGHAPDARYCKHCGESLGP